MFKKFYLSIIILFFLSSVINIYSNTNIGLFRLYSVYEKSFPRFHADVEDALMAVVPDVYDGDVYALNSKASTIDIKKIVHKKKDSRETANDLDEKESGIFRELDEVDYALVYEINILKVFKEADFYDNKKFYHKFKLHLNVLVIDCNKNTIIDENVVAVEFKKETNRKTIERLGIENLSRFFHTYLETSPLFELKIYPVKIGPVLVYLDKGKKDGIRVQNHLVSYENDEFRLKEKALVRVIKSDETSCVASILFSNGPITEDMFFTKKDSINLEVQLAGGFSLADPDNNVQTKNESASFLPYASIRGLIPVGIAFFRPVVQFEFNFFYLNNALLIPFSFETGAQGEFRIHRFEVDLGLLIGALFAPDEDTNYFLDSVVVRPYLHLSVLPVDRLKIFFEAGYRFYLKNKFYQYWKIDLKGAYFTFGLGLCI